MSKPNDNDIANADITRQLYRNMRAEEAEQAAAERRQARAEEPEREGH